MLYESYEVREGRLLAPYAKHSRDSLGRSHPEATHPYRGPFQRDRDRVLHSGAFRRLSGKMQVFTGEMGDYHRTRLTHTQEVASIARTIGRALRLNEDLIEALALFHDIGHPPYGHAGEDALAECLSEEGGFSHNRYALTIVEELEIRYPSFPGLNLTHEVLDGQRSRARKDDSVCPLLEVQVVDLADNISYNAHDTDDALKLGLVSMDELSHICLIRDALDQVEEAGLGEERLRLSIVHALIDRQVTDLLANSGERLQQAGLESAADIAVQGFRLQPSKELAEKTDELEAYLYQRVYRHDQIIQIREQLQTRLKRMFSGFLRRPELLPPRYLVRVEKVGLPRAVGDYLAGMTDRFCEQQFQAYFTRST